MWSVWCGGFSLFVVWLWFLWGFLVVLVGCLFPFQISARRWDWFLNWLNSLSLYWLLWSSASRRQQSAGLGKGNMAPRPCQWSICRLCEWHFCIKGWYYEKILIQREGTVINWESRSVLPVCTSQFTWIPAASCRTELTLTFNSADGLSWSATTEAGRKEHLGVSSWGWWELAELLVSFAIWKAFSLFLTIIILSYDLSPLISFWYSCQVT